MSKQTPSHQQSKFSQSKLDEIYERLCLDEFCINKEKAYNLIEEGDGDDSLILETLNNMSN